MIIIIFSHLTKLNMLGGYLKPFVKIIILTSEFDTLNKTQESVNNSKFIKTWLLLGFSEMFSLNNFQFPLILKAFSLMYIVLKIPVSSLSLH